MYFPVEKVTVFVYIGHATLEFSQVLTGDFCDQIPTKWYLNKDSIAINIGPIIVNNASYIQLNAVS